MGKQGSKKGVKSVASSASKTKKTGSKISKSDSRHDIFDNEDNQDLVGKRKQRAEANDKYSHIEPGSDDDDNKVLYGDDESIDSNGDSIGWNSDDEMTYGSLVKSKNNVGNKKAKLNLRDDEASEEEEEGGTLLSDMLSGLATRSSKPAGGPDAAIDDLFGQDASNSEEEDSDSASDVDGYEKMLSAVDKFSKTPDSMKQAAPNKNKGQFAPEDKFSTADSSKISMSALIGSLSNVRGMSAVKSKLADLEKTTSAPKAVDKVISDRAERKIAYDSSKSDMNKWQSLVSNNRNLSTLDLAQDKRQLPSYKGLIEKFEPSNDLERDINMVLVETAATESSALKSEEDALQARHITPEQMKENLGELAKVRALMFYEQMKRHRVNKIKSKAYHRIRNKKLRKNKGVDGEIDLKELSGDEGNEDAEAEAVARVQERMNLKHQNTGKWAKMALQYGKGNKELRMAYHESVQLGHELAKKVDRVEDKNADRYSDNSSDDGDAVSSKDKMVAKLRDFINGDAASAEDDGGLDNSSKFKKLLDMGFMKNAKARQQEKAREEAQLLLREIEEMDQSDDDSDQGGPTPQNAKTSMRNTEDKLVDQERKEAARKQMEALLFNKQSISAGFVTSKAQMNSVPKDDDDTIDNPWLSGINKIDKHIDNKLRGEKSSKLLRKKNSAHNPDAIKVIVPLHDEEIVLRSQDAGTKNAGTSASSPTKQSNLTSRSAISVTMVGSNSEIAVSGALNNTLKNEPKMEKKAILLHKSQEELVKEAFAGPDYEADFLETKQRAVDAELDIDTKKQKILNAVKPGWGDWAGVGLSGVSEITIASRKRQLDNLEEENAKKRIMRKDGKIYNVMISDRRVKANSKYKLAEVPHPFSSREEYERSIQMPLGEEWNASHIVRRNTKPEIMMRAGRIIAPIKLPTKQPISAGKGLSQVSGAASLNKKNRNRRGLQ